MADFQIAVFITYDLYAAAGYTYEAQKWCKKHIEQAINGGTDYTVEVLTPSETPHAPRENIVDDGWPYDTSSACPNLGEATYNDLLEWFDVWHICHDVADAKDANILVTNEASTYGLTTGAESETKTCVAEGSETYKFSSTESRGCGLKYSQMGATVLHEIGHAITEPGTDPQGVDDDWDEEETGDTYQDPFDKNWYTTPMVTYKVSRNECGKTIDYPYNSLPNCFDHYYSQCVDDHLRPL